MKISSVASLTILFAGASLLGCVAPSEVDTEATPEIVDESQEALTDVSGCAPAPTSLAVSGSSHTFTGSCAGIDLAAYVKSYRNLIFNCSGPITISPSAQITIDHDLYLDGKNKLTLDGKGHRIFAVSGSSDVRIANTTFQNGVGNSTLVASPTFGGGGAIAVAYGSSLTVVGSTFKNNAAGYTMSGSPSTIADDNFGGGAIFAQGGSTLDVFTSTFTGNQGTNGGAIKSVSADVGIYSSSFTGNSAPASYKGQSHGTKTNTWGNGGAIEVDGFPGATSTTYKTARLCGLSVKNNTAANQGGGLSVYGYLYDKVSLNYSYISGNSAPAQGGGLFGFAKGMTMLHTHFTKNTSGQGGGLLMGWAPNFTPSLSVAWSIFDDNTSTGFGSSAIHLIGGLSLDHVTVKNNQNTATWSNNGAIAGTISQATYCTFADNRSVWTSPNITKNRTCAAKLGSGVSHTGSTEAYADASLSTTTCW